MKSLRYVLLFLVVFALGGIVLAQGGRGLYAFGPFDTLGIDSVNRGNLNIHLSIPIISKTGRGGSNFTYSLAYDGMVWNTVAADGSPIWTPALNWGWTDITNAQYGYVTYSKEINDCEIPPDGLILSQATYSNFVYHDNKGNSHGIPYSIYHGVRQNGAAPRNLYFST